MRTSSIVLVALAAFGASMACPQCGCGNLAPATCLPPPSPYEALAAALALPSPAPPAPALPADLYAPTGPILDGCGPPPTPLEIIQAPPVTVPGPSSPVIPLPEPALPPTQVLAQKCVVSKAVVKPQIYQRLVQVPTVARFLKKSFTPVLENIFFTAVPQCGQAPPSAVASPCAACGAYPPPPPPPCGCY